MKKELTKPMKQAATKALTELGFSIRKIGELLHMDMKTAMRYRSVELSDEWEQFSSDIKNYFKEADAELAILAVNKIKEKIDKARFFELVGLLKTVRELQMPRRDAMGFEMSDGNKDFKVVVTRGET